MKNYHYGDLKAALIIFFINFKSILVICHSKLQTYKNVFATCSSQICAGMGSNEVHLLLYMYPNTFFEYKELE